MKKLTFILVALLLLTSSVFAKSTDTLNYNRYSNGYGETFNFTEGNINFMVYQNGEFDFFIAHDGFTTEFDFGAVNITFNSGYNYDAYVQYDAYGAVVQIEGTPIYYDYYGRISRIGHTHIRYNHRRLIQFGGLHIHYNHQGYFDYHTGFMNHFNRHYVYRPYFKFYARPLYNHCLVSYNPYRRYYTPKRSHFNRNNRYRRIDSRRGTASTYRKRATTRRSVPKRIDRKSRVTRNNNTRTVRGSSTRNTRNSGIKNSRTRTVKTTRGTNNTRNSSIKNSRTRTTKPIRGVSNTRNIRPSRGTRTVKSTRPTNRVKSTRTRSNNRSVVKSRNTRPSRVTRGNGHTTKRQTSNSKISRSSGKSRRR